MKSFKQFVTEDVDGYVYHVTHTNLVPKILHKGLVPMMKSNWVVAASKARYGNGEIYTFEKLKDAIRWAAKMDWDFYGEMGSGNISILKIKDDKDWEEDEGSPLDKASHEGKWFKKLAAIPKQNIVDVIPVTLELIKD